MLPLEITIGFGINIQCYVHLVILWSVFLDVDVFPSVISRSEMSIIEIVQISGNPLFWEPSNELLILEILLQISGKPDVVKRALYEVSTRLHQNPRKDKPPLNFSKPYGAQSFHPPVTNKLPPANPVWSHRNSSSHGMPLVPLMGAYRDHPSGVGPGGFDAFPSGHGGETSAEFSMKILCSAAKIGGVIGKGGCNVKQLQQETGASIHVEDASTDSNERVIRVSALEVRILLTTFRLVCCDPYCTGL